MVKVWQQDWVSKWALYSPDKICIKEFESGKSITYKQLNHQAETLAFYLNDKFGLKKGSRIAIISDFCIEQIILFSLAQKAGYTLIPLNYRLAAAEIYHIIEESCPEIIVYETKYAHLINDIKNSCLINLDDLHNNLQSDLPPPCGFGGVLSFYERRIDKHHPEKIPSEVNLIWNLPQISSG